MHLSNKRLGHQLVAVGRTHVATAHESVTGVLDLSASVCCYTTLVSIMMPVMPSIDNGRGIVLTEVVGHLLVVANGVLAGAGHDQIIADTAGLIGILQVGATARCKRLLAFVQTV